MPNHDMTVSCPRTYPYTIRDEASPDQDVETECGGDIAVTISYGWNPGQAYGLEQEPIPAGVEDVMAEAEPCDCGYTLSQSELDTLEQDFRDNPFDYLDERSDYDDRGGDGPDD